MRRIAYLLAPLALFACADEDLELGESSAAASVVIGPTTTGPTTSTSWPKYSYGNDPLPSRLVPVGCDYFATLYSQASISVAGVGTLPIAGRFTVYGVCTRPSAGVAWQVSGDYDQFDNFEARFAGEIEREAKAGIDLGTGGNGLITKVGPRGGGGPIGQRLLAAAEDLDTTFHVGWPASSNLVTRSAAVGEVIVTPVPSEACPIYPSNLVPGDCESLSVVQAKKADGKFLASGVCSRPTPSIVWQISGGYGSLSCLRRAVAGEIVNQSQSFGLDIGYGSNGLITKKGPVGGGGPVGGPDSIYEQALELDTQLIDRWELEIAAPPPTGGNCLPTDISCPIVVGP